MRRITFLLSTGLYLASFTGSLQAHDTTGPKIATAIVAAIQKCWSMPELGDGERPHVELKLLLGADGALSGKPEIVQAAQGSNAQVFTESTIRAVEQCQPYKMLLEYPHERWREILGNFDPPPP